MSTEEKWNPSAFVDSVIRRLDHTKSQKPDSAFQAVMRRADNPNQSSCAWEYLIPFCNIANERERLAFALVGAAIAREKPQHDGSVSIGTALCMICKGDSEAMERESRRLRRLIACDSTIELIPVLRPVLQYIQSKAVAPVSYERLLLDLLYWNEKTKISWAKDFYNKDDSEEESPEEN